ncbi:hypothetical protein IIF7_02691 [Zunongwangia atlantica 22II14-10F7]|uniref:Uncharacterized protein n=2 Tax=Zunongwangia TaxID=417127 RepID=A0A1Y1T758_9FLAO|nr:hypothetical protein IIF7_02691 [Zunongwangia atlantica 22II14-10F7]
MLKTLDFWFIFKLNRLNIHQSEKIMNKIFIIILLMASVSAIGQNDLAFHQEEKNTSIKSTFSTRNSEEINNSEASAIATKSRSLGSFDQSNIHSYYNANEGMQRISARHFEFKEYYNSFPYLSRLKLLTKSRVKNAEFNIQLYSVNKDGKPSDLIYDKDIIGIAQKGKDITEIDLAHLNITFPKNGLFVAIQWLEKDKNKYQYSYKPKGLKRIKAVNIEPSFGIEPTNNVANRSYNYIRNTSREEGELKSQLNYRSYPEAKYDQLAMELILTN